MLPLEQQNDVEVLRQMAVLYRDEAKRLAAENAKLRGQTTEGSQEFLNARLRDQVTRLRIKFFGFGREELKPKGSRPVGHQQQELKLHSRRPHVESDTARAPDKKGQAPELGNRFDQIEHDLTDEQLHQENVVREIPVKTNVPREPWKKLDGLAQESVEITIVERTYKKVVHRQARYKLKDEYNSSGKDVIITAPGPIKIKPGCQYSVDFALAVVSDKYEFHLPLERQRRKMEAAGLSIEVKTLFELARSVASHCDEAVVPKICRDVKADFCAVHL